MTAEIEHDAVIEEMVQRLVERFDPLQVVLFGSYARGDARPDSDVDLLLVLPEAEDTRAAAADAQKLLRGTAPARDVIVTTPLEIWRMSRVPGSLLRHALAEGRVMYEHDERPTEARRLLRLAGDDLRVAELSADEGIDWSSCFHAQQAAEKALKAALTIADVDYPRTHDLDALLALFQDGWPLRDEFGGLAWLSEWAVLARYAGNGRATEQAADALATARSMLDAVTRDLRAHGLELEA